MNRAVVPGVRLKAHVLVGLAHFIMIVGICLPEVDGLDLPT